MRKMHRWGTGSARGLADGAWVLLALERSPSLRWLEGRVASRHRTARGARRALLLAWSRGALLRPALYRLRRPADVGAWIEKEAVGLEVSLPDPFADSTQDPPAPCR